jgi:hypothetical protein
MRSSFSTLTYQLAAIGSTHHGPLVCVIEAVVETVHEEPARPKVGTHVGGGDKGLHAGYDYILQTKSEKE